MHSNINKSKGKTLKKVLSPYGNENDGTKET